MTLETHILSTFLLYPNSISELWIFQVVFFFIKINWQSQSYFVPVCITHSCTHFTKPLKSWDIISYAVNSPFIYTSASIHAYFLLYSYPECLELKKYMFIDFICSYFSRVRIVVIPKAQSQLGHLLAMWPSANYWSL